MGETDGWIYPSLGFCQEILWMESMVDVNRSKAAEGFCEEVIITSYHWLLTDEKASGARRKIDGRNLRNDASRLYFNKWIRRSMGGNLPFYFAILNVVQFLLMETSRIWEKMAEMKSMKESATKDKWSGNWEVISVAVHWSRTHDIQGIGYQEITGGPLNKENRWLYQMV